MADEKGLVFEVTDNNFETQVLESNLPVLVDFWAEWCGPCRALAPVLEEVARDNNYKDKIKICKVDVDKNPTLAAKFSIRSIPTMLLFKNGKKEKELFGSMAKSKILEAIDSL